jgi:hypothetical protein
MTIQPPWAAFDAAAAIIAGKHDHVYVMIQFNSQTF